MGNGTKHTADVAKARPFEALADIAIGKLQGTGQESGAALAVEYCEVPRRLAFEANARSRVATGDLVRLQAGDVPYVVAGNGSVIGTVTDPQAAAIRHCLIDGYTMSGMVTVLDGDTRRGQLEIAGQRE